MAQYFTDFSTNQVREDPPPPDGWTRFWQSPTFVGWDVIQYNGVNCVSPQAIGPSASFNTLAWDAPGIVGTLDAVLTYTPDYDPYVINNAAPFGLMVASDIATRGYAVGFFFDPGTNSVRLSVRRFQEMLGSLAWFNVQSVPFAASEEEMDGIVYKLRVQVSGTNIKARAWQASDPEPDTWQIDVTHGSVVPGYVGLCGAFYGGTREIHQFPKYYSVAVGTDGDPAPEGEEEGAAKGSLAASAALLLAGSLSIGLRGSINAASATESGGPWTLATDFRDYPLDQFPYDWTQRESIGHWSTWAVLHPAGWEKPHLAILAADGTYSRGLSWDAAGIVDDVEVLTSILGPPTVGSVPVGVAVRGQDPTRAYVAGLYDVGGTRSLVIYDLESSTVLGSVPVTITSGFWYWIRFQAVGNNLRARIWRAGTPEPETWPVEVVDSKYASGWVGVWTYERSGGQWDFFSVGANGASAPMTAALVVEGTVTASSGLAGEAEIAVTAGQCDGQASFQARASVQFEASCTIEALSRISGVPYTPAQGAQHGFLVVEGRPWSRVPGSPGVLVIDGRPYVLVGAVSGYVPGATEISGKVTAGSVLTGSASSVIPAELQGEVRATSSLTADLESGSASSGLIFLHSTVQGRALKTVRAGGTLNASSAIDGELLSLVTAGTVASTSALAAAPKGDLTARATIDAGSGLTVDTDLPGFPTATGRLQAEAGLSVTARVARIVGGASGMTSELVSLPYRVTGVRGSLQGVAFFLATPDTGGLIPAVSTVQGRLLRSLEGAGVIGSDSWIQLDGAGEVSARGSVSGVASGRAYTVQMRVGQARIEIVSDITAAAGRTFRAAGVLGGRAAGAVEYAATVYLARASFKGDGLVEGTPANLLALTGAAWGMAGDEVVAGLISPIAGEIAAVALAGTDLRIAQEAFGFLIGSTDAWLKAHRRFPAAAGASMASGTSLHAWLVVSERGPVHAGSTVQAGAALLLTPGARVSASALADLRGWVAALGRGQVESLAGVVLYPGVALTFLGSVQGVTGAGSFAVPMKLARAVLGIAASSEGDVVRVLRSPGILAGASEAAGYGSRDGLLRGVASPAALLAGHGSELLSFLGQIHAVSFAKTEGAPGPGGRRVGSLIGKNYVAIDTAVEVVMVSFVIKQGDTSPAIEALLRYENGAVVDLSGTTVRFHMADLNGNLIVSEEAEVIDPARGRVRYSWRPEDTSVAGRYLAEWEVTYGDGGIETFPNHDQILVRIISQLG